MAIKTTGHTTMLQIRTARNSLISSVEYKLFPHSTATDEEKAEVVHYLAYLRDLPETCQSMLDHNEIESIADFVIKTPDNH